MTKEQHDSLKALLALKRYDYDEASTIDVVDAVFGREHRIGVLVALQIAHSNGLVEAYDEIAGEAQHSSVGAAQIGQNAIRNSRAREWRIGEPTP